MSLENSNPNQPINPTISAVIANVLLINTAFTIISPASNPNGLILHNMAINGNASANMSVISRTSPPSDTITGRVIGTSISKSIFGGQASHITSNSSIIIPAGQGLYFISDSNVTVFGNLQLTAL